MGELSVLERVVLARLPVGVFGSAAAEVAAARYIADAVELLVLAPLRAEMAAAAVAEGAGYRRGLTDAARLFEAEVGRRASRPSPVPRVAAS